MLDTRKCLFQPASHQPVSPALPLPLRLLLLPLLPALPLAFLLPLPLQPALPLPLRLP